MEKTIFRKTRKKDTIWLTARSYTVRHYLRQIWKYKEISRSPHAAFQWRILTSDFPCDGSCNASIWRRTKLQISTLPSHRRWIAKPFVFLNVALVVILARYCSPSYHIVKIHRSRSWHPPGVASNFFVNARGDNIERWRPSKLRNLGNLVLTTGLKT